MNKLAWGLIFNFLLACFFTPLAWAEENKKPERVWVSTQEMGGNYSYADSQGINIKGKQQISQYNLNYQATPQWILGLTMQINRTGKLKLEDHSTPQFSVDSNGHQLTLGAKADYKLHKSGPWDTSLILSYNQLPVSLYKHYSDSRTVLNLDHQLFLLSLATEYQVSPRFALIGEVGVSPWKSKMDVDKKQVSADGNVNFQNFHYKAQTNTWLLKGKYKLDQKITLTLGYRYLEIKGDAAKEWVESPVKEKVNEWIIGLDVNLN